tara:strand:+ start:101 stop:457 length:357 start_codon:yes stop_codon:yes gene_type:complete
MERYFYFGESTVATTGTASMFALSDFLGISHSGDDHLHLHFKARNGSAKTDTVQVDFGSLHLGLGDSTRQVKGTMEDIALLLKHNNKNPFVNFWDGVSKTGVGHRMLYLDQVAVATVA